jgi:hypothetical protein
MTEPTTLADELKDAISARTALLVVGVLLLQVLFIWSYAAAFHRPAVSKVPVAVVVPAAAAPTVLHELNTLPGTPISATLAPSRASAVGQLIDREVQAVFIPSTTSSVDHVIVQSASGPSGADAMTAVFTKVDGAAQRRVIVTDRTPSAVGDERSLTSFYLVIGWCVGGYLLASLLGMSFGSRPANTRRAAIRLGCVALYALVSGLLGSLVVGPVLHALPSAWSVWWIGALIVFATGAFSMALQVAFGTLGLGLTILLFVILGNASAGGPYPWALLPPFWRAIGPWLPNGAGVDAVRATVYLDGASIGRDLWVLVGYGVVGVLITFLVVGVIRRPVATLPGDDRELVEPDAAPEPVTTS